MESMSSAPYYLPGARRGYRLGHQEVKDAVITDALWDPHENLHMGGCAERCATQYAITRKDQDDYAAESFRRANRAQAEGWFAAEIAEFEEKTSKGETIALKEDEGPKRVNYDKIPQLKPAFAKDGTITPANASTLNDGAAVVILAKDAASVGATARPLAKIVSFGSHSQDPLWFTTAPIEAARTALARAGWKVEDVDLWEVNEAFAVVPIAFARALGIPGEKLNVWGGAISLGHPVGASGARILTTLVHALRMRGARRGVAAICAGGGDGVAVCVELNA
jgi:acetyl-CoA C-acetyltransferase